MQQLKVIGPWASELLHAEREQVFGPKSFGLACQHMGLGVYQRMGPPHVARSMYSMIGSVPLYVLSAHGLYSSSPVRLQHLCEEKVHVIFLNFREKYVFPP